jgi:hypothetical protein
VTEEHVTLLPSITLYIHYYIGVSSVSPTTTAALDFAVEYNTQSVINSLQILTPRQNVHCFLQPVYIFAFILAQFYFCNGIHYAFSGSDASG